MYACIYLVYTLLLCVTFLREFHITFNYDPVLMKRHFYDNIERIHH